MRGRSLVLVVAVVLAGFMAFDSSPNVDDRPAVTQPSGGPDLLSVFRQNDDLVHAAQDACDLGRLCKAIASQIEYDASRDRPRLTTGKQLDDLRRWAREYFMDGKSLGVEYPKLKDEIKTYLDAQLGSDGGPVTTAQRAKWVDAFRTIAQAAEYASAQLK